MNICLILRHTSVYTAKARARKKRKQADQSDMIRLPSRGIPSRVYQSMLPAVDVCSHIYLNRDMDIDITLETCTRHTYLNTRTLSLTHIHECNRIGVNENKFDDKIRIRKGDRSDSALPRRGLMYHGMPAFTTRSTSP